MYSDKLVVAVKASGKILREHKDSVYVPFGAEYSLLIKNKNTVRALVSVEIDGVDVTGGTELIIQPNGEIDLERFIKNGNFNKGNRFKFIERTKKIEDGPRGIQAEDGLIRVSFKYEQMKAAYIPGPIVGAPTYWPSPRWYPATPYQPGYWLTSTLGDTTLGSIATGSIANGVNQLSSLSDTIAHAASSDAAKQAYTVNASNTLTSSYSAGGAMRSMAANVCQVDDVSFASATASVNDVGITVAGSESDQKFVAGAWFPTDGVAYPPIILKLRGQVNDQPVKKPITVDTKQECPTCGTKNKHGTKFCRECGTALTIL